MMRFNPKKTRDVKVILDAQTMMMNMNELKTLFVWSKGAKATKMYSLSRESCTEMPGSDRFAFFNCFLGFC